ncbi:MAG: hypothetical protein QM709_07260 [Spongiibacteraceae bacterium]
MSPATLSFLQSIGATPRDNGDCFFQAEPAALDTAGAHNMIVPLSHYGLLEIHGPEAEKFLQGQITCSATEVTPALSSPGAYCTVKGRVVTSFQLLRPQTDTFWLRMRGDLLDIAARTFGKYIVFSKAKLAAQESMIGIGLSGPSIAKPLLALIGALPSQQHGTVSYGEGLLLQCDANGTQFEYWGPAVSATALWTHCSPQATAVGSRYWRWLQIRSGNAEICAATSEMFLPHMLNYHETGAINFKKGCYTGQEIVARTHYRGQVKRHVAGLRLEGPAPAAGSDITDANAKVVGSVVDSVATVESVATADRGAPVENVSNAAELLAVIADDSIDASASLHVGAIEARTL